MAICRPCVITSISIRCEPNCCGRKNRWKSLSGAVTRKYGRSAKNRWPWLRVERLLGEKGIAKDNPAGRAEFARQMGRRRAEEAGADYGAVRRGWCLGGEEFRRELLAAEADGVGANPYGSD
jgi:nitroreductase